MASVLVLASAPYAIPQWARGFEIRTQLLKADGSPLPLPTGAGAPTVRFTLAWTDVVPAVLVRGRDRPGAAKIVDGPKGIVGYTVQAEDFARTGGYRAEFWVESVPEVFAFPVRRKLDLRVWKTLEKL
jgi:hypothetical protein